MSDLKAQIKELIAVSEWIFCGNKEARHDGNWRTGLEFKNEKDARKFNLLLLELRDSE